MPSTYTVNLGIEKPATGEQSGTWGDTTNVNFDIIDQAVNGSERVTLTSAGTSGSPNDLNIVNGSTTSSEGRNKWIEIYSASDLGGSAYVRLVPNDAEKILFIRNSLAGSQSVLLFQGTYNASNDLEIPAGVDMVVRFDGAGASATVTDVFTKLRATEITTPTLTAGTADINGGSVDGATIGAASASTGAFTTLTASTNLNIASSTTVDGVLDEDNMASDSATKLATQQSIKAYVDTQVGANNELSEVLANGNTSGANNLIMDNGQALTTNTINETTAGSGVTIDSVLLKDDVVNATDIETSNISANDGTAAATIADSTGLFTITSFASGSVNIDGGAIDGTNIGASSAGSGAFTTLSASGDLAVDTNVLYVDTTNNRVGIQTSTPSLPLDVRAALSTVYTGTAQSAEHINIFNTATGAVGLTSGMRFQTRALDATGQSFFIGSTATSGGYAPDFKFQKQTGATTYQELAALNTGEAVFNDPGNNYDFRVESDGASHMLFVDAGNNRVGIGEASPDTPLHITTSSSGNVITIESTDAGTAAGPSINLFRNSSSPANNDLGPAIFFRGDNSVGGSHTYANIFTQYTDVTDGAEDANVMHQISIAGQNRTVLGLTTSEVTINDESQNLDFRVESDSNTHMLFVDAGSDQVAVGTGSLSDSGFMFGVQGSVTIGDRANSVAGVYNSLELSGYPVNDTSADYGSYGALRFYANTTYTSGARRALLTNAYRTSQFGFLIGDTDPTSEPNVIIQGVPTNALVPLAFENTGTVVVNQESAAGVDFRVESDGNTHMLFVDAGNNSVNINSSDVNGSFALKVLGTAASGARTGFFGGPDVNTATSTSAPVLTIENTSPTTANMTLLGFQTSSSVSTGVIGFKNENLASGYGTFYLASRGATNGWANKLAIYDTEVTWNEDGLATFDFRVESNSNTNMIFVDASANAVGIGRQPDSAGNYALDVNGDIRFGDGNLLAGIALPYIVTTTRTVGTGNQWFMVYEETTSPSPRTVYLRINASGDNTSFQGDFIINLAGYNFQHSVTLTDYQYYNVAKLEEIKTVNPSGGVTTQIWVRVGAISSSVGTLTAQCSSSALVSSLSAGSEPSATIGTVHLYDDSWPSNSARVSTVFSNGAEFADASVARFRRQDGSRSSYINHDSGGMNIATSNTGDNMDITVAGGSLDVNLGDNYEMAVNEGSASADFRVESNDNTHMLFIDGSSNQVNIGGSAFGSNVVGIDAGRIRLQKTTDWNIESYGDTSNSAHIRFLHNSTEVGGITTTASATTYATSSDFRLKENIADADDAGALIDAIQVRQFDWIADGEHQRYGMVAQELNTVAPEAVSEGETEDDMMGVDYSKLVPMLVKEIQSLRARVADLEL